METQVGPSGVSSPALRAASTSLSVPSCRQPTEQDATLPARSANDVPWCGEPSVSTRRTTPALPSATHRRATSPPAEYPTRSTVASPVRCRASDTAAPSASAEARRSPVPSPGSTTSVTSLPAAVSASARDCREPVPPPYPGTSRTGPGRLWDTGPSTGEDGRPIRKVARTAAVAATTTSRARTTRRRAGARPASTLPLSLLSPPAPWFGGLRRGRRGRGGGGRGGGRGGGGRAGPG